DPYRSRLSVEFNLQLAGFPIPGLEIDGRVDGMRVAGGAAVIAQQAGRDGIVASDVPTCRQAERKAEFIELDACAERAHKRSGFELRIEKDVAAETAEAEAGKVDERRVTQAREADSEPRHRQAGVEREAAAGIDQLEGDS